MRFEDILQHPERAKIYTPKLAQKLRYKLRRAKYIHLVERVRSKERGTQFQIKSAKLRGTLKPFKEIYIAKPCDLFLIVTYHNSGRSARALVTQKIGDSVAKVTVLFGRDADYTLELKYRIDKPEEVPVLADIRKRRWRSDARLEKTLALGLADDRPKPVAEYPENEASNETLDIAPPWKEGKGVYPEKLPDGLTITPADFALQTGAIKWGKNYYMVPIEECRINFSWTVKNGTDRALTIEPVSFMLSTLYEDNVHMSYVNIQPAGDRKRVGVGKAGSYSLTVPIPEWCYGRVTGTHVCKFYFDGMMRYYGGPIWYFFLGRVLLP